MTTDDDKYRVNYKGIDYLFNHPRGWDIFKSDDRREARRRPRYVVWTLGDQWTPGSFIHGSRRTRRRAEKLARQVTLWLEQRRTEFGRARPFQFVYVTDLDDRPALS